MYARPSARRPTTALTVTDAAPAAPARGGVPLRPPAPPTAGRRPTRRPPRRRVTPPLAAALTLALLGCSQGDDGGSDGAEQQAGTAEDGSTEVDPRLWVDPEGPGPEQVRQWEEEGREDDAATLRLLADQPVAEWPTGDGDPGPRVREIATAAEAEERAAVLVAYNVPHRDCGQYSQGGAEDADAYAEWIDRFAESIGDAEAIVILEPDAVPHIVDGCTDPMYHDERYGVLSDAVERLKEQPGTRVYLDAGNPSWITDPDDLAEPLWRSGLGDADGFALNVSNYQDTDAVLAYGRELSEVMDGAHFVVDTSRNGNGPLDEGGASEESWCNPPGRGLGEPPTTEPAEPLADAYLWIKRPGESDGECRGGPRAGDWWPEYALGLAREAEQRQR